MKQYFILTIWFLSFSYGYGQIEIPTSLEDAIYKALEKNGSVKNKELEIEKLNLQGKGIRNKYIPTIEATANYLYFDNRLTIDLPTTTLPITGISLFEGSSSFKNRGNILHGGIIAKTVLFSGFQIVNGSKAIAQKAIGTKYLTDSEKEGIIKEVISTFDKLTLLNKLEELINDSDKRLQNETRRVNKAIEQGLAIPYDRDKIKLASLELKSKKIELQGKRKVIYKKLNYLTSYTDSEITNVHYDLIPYLITDSNLNAENKQEIKALESFKSAYEYLLKKEKGTYLPTLGAFGGVTYSRLFDAEITTPLIQGINQSLFFGLNSMTISPNWMIGATLKWEIFSGFEREHKIHEAKINIEQIQNQIDDTKEKLQLLLENNYANYAVQNQKIEVASQQEKVADNNLKLAIKQYKEGLINISERLESENDFYKAAFNRINVLIEQRLSAIETVIATGELTKYLSK